MIGLNMMLGIAAGILPPHHAPPPPPAVPPSAVAVATVGQATAPDAARVAPLPAPSAPVSPPTTTTTMAPPPTTVNGLDCVITTSGMTYSPGPADASGSCAAFPGAVPTPYTVTYGP
jgi:hypothetical protein